MSITFPYNEKGKSTPLTSKLASVLNTPKSVVGLVSSITSEVVKGRNVWQIFMADGKKVSTGNPAIAQALGGTGTGIPTIPVELKIVQKGPISVAVSAQIAGEQVRRRAAVDLTNPEFVNKIAELDACDAAAIIHAEITNSRMAQSSTGSHAVKTYIEWKERSDVGSQAWRLKLMDVLRQQKVAAEIAVKRGERGFFVKRLSNVAMNLLSCAIPEKKQGAPKFLGSMVVGQLHEAVPLAKYNTAVSVVWGAYRTIARTIGAEASKDLKIISDMVARSVVANDQKVRANELIGALTWSWQVLRAKQPDMEKNRYAGPIGGAIQNLETTIQWIGGTIPDYGPLAGVPKHIDKAQDKDFIRAIAIQRARGTPIISVGRGEDGNAVGMTSNREKAIFGKNMSAKVVAPDGTVIYDANPDETAAAGPRI